MDEHPGLNTEADGLRSRSYSSPREVERCFGAAACQALGKKQPFDVRYPLKTPGNVTFFVNAICNAFCEHCFIIHDQPKSQDKTQLSLETSLRIFQSCTNPTAIMLTGGEPLLRNDIEDLSIALLALPLTKSLALNSNGSCPEKIETLLRRVCHGQDKPVHLQLSLDGLARTNDEIRRIPRGFAKVMETCGRCLQLAKKYGNLSFVIGITLMKQNAAEVEFLVDELEQRGYPSKISLARGNDFSTFDVPEDLLEPAYNPNQEVQMPPRDLRAVLAQIERKHPHYFDDFQRKKLDTMIGVLERKSRLIPCYAGYEDGVIYANGDILLCEQVRPFGHLSKWDWNMADAWNSREAMEHRLKLCSCSCIHGCNICTSLWRQDHC